MYKIQFFFLFFLFLLLSNKTYSQTAIPKIAVDPKSNPKGKLMLSDIAESIEYIPLETKKECLVGTIRSFDISENYILIPATDTRDALLFKRNGEFLNPIGRQGQGPGEYFRPSKSFIDEANKQIIVFNSYPLQVLFYDLKGKHLKTVKLSTRGLYLRQFNDHFFIATDNYHGEIPFAYEIRDRNFQIKKEAVATIPYEPRGSGRTMPGIPREYMYNDKIYAKEVSLNDTVYSIDKNFIFTPQYRINFGKYEITTDLRAEGDPGTYFKRWKEYAQFDRAFENGNYLFLSYFYGGEILHYGYYDKNTKKLLYFNSSKGIPNDYDSGIDFWAQRQDNDHWYGFYDAYLFEEELTNKTKIKPKGSNGAIESFKKLYSALDPEDNPVLVIIKLKK